MSPKKPNHFLIASIAGACLLSTMAVHAEVDTRTLVTQVLAGITGFGLDQEGMLASAKTLFWSLASMSLVWTMGAHVVRQDFGDMLMEILRFMVVTGLLYWLLVSASEYGAGDGFVQMIVNSFYMLPTGAPADITMQRNANDILLHGLNVFFSTINDSSQGNIADQIVGALLGTIVLILLACLAAQFLLAMTMAWVLAYAGIFLLGFGGGRWTAPIAISYYKHIVGLGIAILTLTIIGYTGSEFLSKLASSGPSPLDVSHYASLGVTLAVAVLMLVLGTKVPQLMFTLVTGSPTGVFMGSAAAAGAAFASGGQAIASAMQRPSGGGAPGGGADAVMAAVSRGAGAGDPFHVSSGSDPFGVPRSADPLRHGTAFGRRTTTATPIAEAVQGHSGGATDDVRANSPEPTSGEPKGRPDYEAELAAASHADGGATRGASHEPQRRDQRVAGVGHDETTAPQSDNVQQTKVVSTNDVSEVIGYGTNVPDGQSAHTARGEPRDVVDTAVVGDVSQDHALHANVPGATDHAAGQVAPISAARAAQADEGLHEALVSMAGRHDVPVPTSDAGHSGASAELHVRPDGNAGRDRSVVDDASSDRATHVNAHDHTSDAAESATPVHAMRATQPGDEPREVPVTADERVEARMVTSDTGHSGKSAEMLTRPDGQSGRVDRGASTDHRVGGAVDTSTFKDTAAPDVQHLPGGSTDAVRGVVGDNVEAGVTATNVAPEHGFGDASPVDGSGVKVGTYVGHSPQTAMSPDAGVAGEKASGAGHVGAGESRASALPHGEDDALAAASRASALPHGGEDALASASRASALPHGGEGAVAGASRASALPQGGEGDAVEGSRRRKGRKNALAGERDEPVMGAVLGDAAPDAAAVAPGGVEAGVEATARAEANADDSGPVRPRRKRARKATQPTPQADLAPPEALQPDAPDATPPEENNPS